MELTACHLNVMCMLEPIPSPQTSPPTDALLAKLARHGDAMETATMQDGNVSDVMT